MKNFRKAVADRLARAKSLALLSLAVLFVAAQSHAQPRPSQPRLARNCPLPRLDTRRGLYIRPDGTRVYKDPAPPTSRVFTYRRKDGSIARTFVGPRRSYGSRKAPRRFARRHRRQKHRAARRR